MIVEYALVILAIVVMVLFTPVAVGIGIRILAPDHYTANRKNILIALGIAELVLLALLFFVLFGLVV